MSQVRQFTHLVSPAEIDNEGGEHADILIHYPSRTVRVTAVRAVLTETPRAILTIVFEVAGVPQTVMLGIREDEKECHEEVIDT